MSPAPRWSPTWNVALWILVAVVGGSALTYVVSVVVTSILRDQEAEAPAAPALPPGPTIEEVAAEATEAEAARQREIVADHRRRTEALLASAEALDRSNEEACLRGVEAIAPQVSVLESQGHALPREWRLLASATNYAVLCASCSGSSPRNCDRARSDLRDLDAQ